MTFGSFTELPSRQLPHAESQPQNGPNLAQQRSGPLPQGPPPHQQQQQIPRRGSGPRSSQGYKGPNFDPSHGQPGSMHPNAAFNFMPGGGPGNYMPQQAYPYAQQAHYYQNGMMMPQGSYQQPAYSAPQPPSRNHQQAQGYQRPQPQAGRPVAMAPAQSQQPHPSGPAAPPIKRKTKALVIIDPATQQPIVSPRGESHGLNACHAVRLHCTPVTKCVCHRCACCQCRTQALCCVCSTALDTSLDVDCFHNSQPCTAQGASESCADVRHIFGGHRLFQLQCCRVLVLPV